MDLYHFYESYESPAYIKQNKKKNDEMSKFARTAFYDNTLDAFRKEMDLTKLKFPFLTMSQIQGRTMDKFGIPNIMGKPYKRGVKVGTITYMSVHNMVKSFSEKKYQNKYPFVKRRHTLAGTLVPIETITNKINRGNNTRAIRNLQNIFKLYSEEDEDSEENYSIDSFSEISDRETQANEHIFSEVESSISFHANNTTKTYERKNSYYNFNRKNNKAEKNNNICIFSDAITGEKGTSVVEKTLSNSNIGDDTSRQREKIQCCDEKRKRANSEEQFNPEMQNTIEDNHDKAEQTSIMQTGMNQNKNYHIGNSGCNEVAQESTKKSDEAGSLEETTNSSNTNSIHNECHESYDRDRMDELSYPTKDVSKSSDRKNKFQKWTVLAEKLVDLSDKGRNINKEDMCNDNTDNGDGEDDEITIIGDYRPKNETQIFYGRKTKTTSTRNYSLGKRKSLSNFMIIKDNRLKKKSSIPNNFSSKRFKKIKQSISFYPNDFYLRDGIPFNNSDSSSLNTETQDSATSTYSPIKAGAILSDENMDKTSIINSLKNDELKNSYENTSSQEKNEEYAKKQRKMSECIILTDVLMQTDIKTDNHTIVQDSDSSSEEEISIKHNPYIINNKTNSLENMDESPTNCADPDSSEKLLDHSSDLPESDNNEINTQSSIGHGSEMSQHCSERDVTFSPHYVVSTHLLLYDSDDSSNVFESSQEMSASNSSQAIENVRSGISEEKRNLQIDKEGYYLANLFDSDTSLPHRRTLRSTSMKEFLRDENDKP